MTLESDQHLISPYDVTTVNTALKKLIPFIHRVTKKLYHVVNP